eukprot:492156_1
MLLFFLAFQAFCCTTQEIEKYRVSNNRILDLYGRECYFHGLNVVYKSPPYLPIQDHFDANLSFSIEDMELLNSLGQNAIRLGVMWPGVEPSKNDYNMTYINNAVTLITTAYNKYNISTLVDCHQDVLSEALCGEGAAVWATEPLVWDFPEPLSAPYNTGSDHIPSREDCAKQGWASYYATQATSSAFQRIYENYNGLADQFADYWGVLAKNFAQISGILGFELMNEPWAGGIYEHPFLMYPGRADFENLQPFYDRIQHVIYGNDSDRMIFFESVTWTDAFNISLDDTGFTHVPGGQKYVNKSVFAFHYYKPPNDGNENKYFSQRTHDGIRLNATSFLTEFNVGDDEGMYNTMDYCDAYLISWLGWEYKKYAGCLPNGTCTGCGYGLFHKNGSLNVGVAKGLSRTYAQKIAGNVRYMKFDWRNGGNYRLMYEVNTDISKPTIIYTNLEYWYPNGFNLNVMPNSDIVTYKINGNYVEIYNSNDNKYNGQNVTVTITPKK